VINKKVISSNLGITNSSPHYPLPITYAQFPFDVFIFVTALINGSRALNLDMKLDVKTL